MAENLTPAEQNALLWPIKAKGAVTRLSPAGDPSISAAYQQAMEQGRFLESSIADANNWLLQKKQLLINQIQTYTHMNQLAVDGQLGHHSRIPKYIADSISILNTANQFQQEIVGLVAAVQQNLAQLLTIERSMIAMVQTNLNAIANLLNNICNWGLPALPSIPNLLPEGMWNWNGFNFAPLANFAKQFATPPSFSFNFSFSQCSVTVPGLTNNGVLGSNVPPSVMTNSGLPLGTEQYIPPLGGSPSTNPTSQPVYGPSFNPNSSMQGAVPNPATISDAYQMPAATYAANIVSLVPALLGDVVEPQDADYSNPNLAVRQPQLRKDLIHYVNLGEIVANNYDPFIMSAWLLYLSADRAGRGGLWIPNFEAVYQQYIQPSVAYLLSNPVPYNGTGVAVEYRSIWDSTVQYEQNDVVTFGGVLYIANAANLNEEPDTNPSTWAPNPQGIVYQNAPVIPLAATFAGLGENALNTLLWMLSYVEASLLGYTRNKTWDAWQNANYLSGVTGSDLDYVPTLTSSNSTTATLGEGTAEFPVTVTFPSAYSAIMAQVVSAASTNILNDLSYQSPRLGNRYTYSPFAVATTVDRFSQFWRDFATNLTAFLAQDPYLVQFAVTYLGTLDGALDPLAGAANAAAYASLQADAASRNRAWAPGTPLLPIPVAPVVTYANSSVPNAGSNGWVSPMELDPVAFLSRPDIQGQPIGVQMAMLRTNLSYAAIQTWSSQMQNAIGTQIANVTALIQNFNQLGFSVNAGATSAPGHVAFDQTAFDYTGNVSSPTTFVIQAAGAYAGSGQIVWTGTGTLTVTVTQDGSPIYTLASAESPLPFSFTGNFAVGDTVQVDVATTGSATVEPGSSFSMIQTSPTPTPPTAPVVVPGDTSTFTADADMAAGTVVQVQPDGGVAPINLFIPSISELQINAPNTVIATVNGHYFVPSDIITFAATTGTTPTINGPQVRATVTAVTPTTVTATLFSQTLGPWTAYPQAANTGTIRLLDESGVLQYPLPDGVTSAAATAGGSVDVGTIFGDTYTVAGASFATGGLVYADLAGGLTQNWTAITSSSLSGTAVLGAGLLTVTVANKYSVGLNVLLSGTGNASLDGRTVAVASVIGIAPNYTGFTAALAGTYTGVITADAGVDYVIMVGRALSPDSLVYEPNIPTLVPA